MKHVFTALVVGSALWLGSGVASAQAPKIKVGRTTCPPTSPWTAGSSRRRDSTRSS